MRRVIPLLALASLAFAPAPVFRGKPDHARDDLKAMQGEWVLAYAHQDGVRGDVTQESVWAIEGDRLATSLDGKAASTYFIRLDGRTEPRSIDLLSRRDDVAPTPGRYSLKGDSLTICVGKDRPRDLSGLGRGPDCPALISTTARPRRR